MKTHIMLFAISIGLLFSASAFGQSYSIDWFAMDGSGGASSGGDFSLSGSSGQSDAAATMTGGDYSLEAGYWSNPLANTSPSGLFERNLIANPDAETGAGSVSGYDVVPVPNWTTGSNFTVTVYGATSLIPWPGPTFGTNIFTGGSNNPASSATQIIDLSAGAAEIDSGMAQFELSGWFGGFSSQNDHSSLTATFLTADSNALEAVTIGNILAVDRTNVTSTLFCTTNNAVPIGTRTIQLLLSMTRTEGSYNDGSADNLSLYLRLPVSSLRITAVQRTGGDLRLSVTSVSGQSYVIQSSDNLSSGSWSTIPNLTFSGTGSTVQQTITNALSQPKQFYRIQQQ